MSEIFKIVSQQIEGVPEFEKVTEEKYRTEIDISGIVKDSMKN